MRSLLETPEYPNRKWYPGLPTWLTYYMGVKNAEVSSWLINIYSIHPRYPEADKYLRWKFPLAHQEQTARREIKVLGKSHIPKLRVEKSFDRVTRFSYSNVNQRFASGILDIFETRSNIADDLFESW